jgi:hypothetical protein
MTLPINLPTALRLALTSNLEIAQAREIVNQARARQQSAQVAVLPNLNLGSTYNQHEGNISKTEGNIIKANRDSLFTGGGPSLAFHTADAIFLPLVARQITASTLAASQRVANDTLLQVAETYFNVLRSRRRIARINETLGFLTSDRPSPARAQSKGMSGLRSKSCVARTSLSRPLRIGTSPRPNWPDCCGSILLRRWSHSRIFITRCRCPVKLGRIVPWRSWSPWRS